MTQYILKRLLWLIPVIVVNILAGMNTYRRALAQMEG